MVVRKIANGRWRWSLQLRQFGTKQTKVFTRVTLGFYWRMLLVCTAKISSLDRSFSNANTRPVGVVLSRTTSKNRSEILSAWNAKLIWNLHLISQLQVLFNVALIIFKLNAITVGIFRPLLCHCTNWTNLSWHNSCVLGAPRLGVVGQSGENNGILKNKQ